MPTARIILGLDVHVLSPDISDEMVKQAYLQKVRDYPPEQNPEKFRRIREAYELLKDEKSRLAYALFHIDDINSMDILSTLFLDTKRSVPTEKQFLNVLRESLQAK